MKLTQAASPLRLPPARGATARSWPLAAPCLLLAGCMVGPDYVPPSKVMPPAYSELTGAEATGADATGRADAAWWNTFDDQRLVSLVERAIAANQRIEVAEARVRQARSAREIARARLYPRLSVGASALRFRGSEAAVGIPGADLDGNLFQLGFDAEWVIDIFGGNRRLLESATADEQAVDARRRGVVLMVAAEAARSYVELRGAQRELAVALSTLADQRETLAVTQDRHATGLASELEVLRARTEVEATAAEVPPIEQATREYVHALSTLLSLEPTALSAELATPTSIPSVPSTIAVGVPSDLLRRRPDVQAAERRIASSTAMVGVAIAELFPRFVLGASAGLASRKTSDLFNGNTTGASSDYFLSGPAINWTLFDGGRRRAAIESSEAEVAAAKALYEETVLTAFREVESALVAVDRSRARVADIERLAVSAREALTIAQGDYRNGLLDQLTVLDAQRQASRADMQLAQAQVALTVNAIRLYKALGGGWETAEPAATPSSTDTETQPVKEKP